VNELARFAWEIHKYVSLDGGCRIEDRGQNGGGKQTKLQGPQGMSNQSKNYLINIIRSGQMRRLLLSSSRFFLVFPCFSFFLLFFFSKRGGCGRGCRLLWPLISAAFCSTLAFVSCVCLSVWCHVNPL